MSRTCATIADPPTSPAGRQGVSSLGGDCSGLEINHRRRRWPRCPGLALQATVADWQVGNHLMSLDLCHNLQMLHMTSLDGLLSGSGLHCGLVVALADSSTCFQPAEWGSKGRSGSFDSHVKLFVGCKVSEWCAAQRSDWLGDVGGGGGGGAVRWSIHVHNAKRWRPLHI